MPTYNNTMPAPSHPDPERATRVLRQFRVVFNAVRGHFREVEKSAGIGGAQVWALSVIQSSPGIGVSGLAQALDVHQSTASNLVKVLAERGLVAASKDGADRRTVALRILPKGENVLSKTPGPFAGVLPEALSSLDGATLGRLEADLATLIGGLDADQRAAKLPLAEL